MIRPLTALLRMAQHNQRDILLARQRIRIADDMLAIYATTEMAMKPPVTNSSLAWFRRVWIGCTVALFGTATALTIWSALCSTEF